MTAYLGGLFFLIFAVYCAVGLAILTLVLEKAKELKRKSVLLLVSRGGDSRFVALGVDSK